MIRRLPAKYRAHKNLYLSMLSRYFPRVMAFPLSTAENLPDWDRDMHVSAALRSFFMNFLDTKGMQSSVFAELLDIPSFERLRDDFFHGDPPRPASLSPYPRSRMGRLVPDRIKRRWPVMDRLRRLGRGTVWRMIRQPGPCEVLRSIALVRLLEDQLSALR